MSRLLCLTLSLISAVIVTSCSQPSAAKPDSRLFELRVYHPNPGKLDALNARFRNHTLALFEKHGMENVGYWTTNADGNEVLVYLIAFPDRAAKDAAWKGFMADPEWQKVYQDSIKDGRLVSRVDSTLLRMTDFSPALVQESKSPERLFELRTYKAESGRLKNLDTRFKDATIDLFEKHGATNLCYFHIEAGEAGAEDTLIYLLAHKDMAARDAMFEAFRNDPNWQEARAASEKTAGGSLTIPGGVTHQFLAPTDYSKIK